MKTDSQQPRPKQKARPTKGRCPMDQLVPASLIRDRCDLSFLRATDEEDPLSTFLDSVQRTATPDGSDS